MRTEPTELATGAQYVVDLDTGTVLNAAGLRLVDWDDLGQNDRDLLDSGHDSDAWSVGYRCGRPLAWELEPVSVAFVISIRSWFDRVHGNTYFAGDVVNVTTGHVAAIRLQYGTGRDAYLRAAANTLGFELETLAGCSVVFVAKVARKADTAGVLL